MAEEEEEGAEEEGVAEIEAPKGSWLKQFVILAAMVLIGQGVVAYVLVTQQVLPKFGVEEQGEGKADEPEEVMREAVAVEQPHLYEIDFTNSRVLNPQDYHSIRFLSVHVIIELDTPETRALLDNEIISTKVNGIAREILTTTWYTEMDDVDEREALREKLKVEINASGLLAEGAVTGVYFRQFILQ